jgi:CysZ protein
MIKNILSGISAYAGAFSLISRLKLGKYFVIPIVISVLTATIIGFTAYGLSDTIGQFLAKIWIWDWGKETVTTIASFVGAIFVLVIGLIIYKHIILALSAPFMSAVSEKIEIHVNGSLKVNHRKTTFQQQLWRGIRINSRNLVKDLLQAYYAGFGNMDYTLERHLNYEESINFVGKNKGVSIGNGIVFMVCLLIPVIGIIIVLPLSVTAASVKTVELLNIENERPIL